MNTEHINLVSLKPFYTLTPSFFEDTIESINELLIAAGFKTSISCNQIDPSVLNIIFGANSHLSPPLAEIRSVAKPEFTVVFNMEQIKYGNSFVTPEYISFLAEYKVWDYNQNNINAMRLYNSDIDAFEFPVIPARKFASDYSPNAQTTPLVHDLSFWGASCSRRDELLQSLQRNGIRVNRVNGAFGSALSSAIAGSKICMNIHALDSGIFEVARCLRPIAMGIPIISETSVMPESIDWSQSGIIFCDYADMERVCLDLISHPDEILRLTRKNLEFLSRNGLSAALLDSTRGIVAKSINS